MEDGVLGRAAPVAILYLLSSIFVFTGSGCAVVGLAAYKVHGPPAVPAKYVPPPRPTLVLVENYRHQSSVRDARGTAFATLSITSIARELEAEQILYVELQRSDVNQVAGGEGLSGEATATVRWVDTASGSTLWPTDLPDYLVSAAAKIGTHNASSAQDVRQRMYVQLSDEIARLFYKWKPEETLPEGFVE
jgi:hypothetical protein